MDRTKILCALVSSAMIAGCKAGDTSPSKRPSPRSSTPAHVVKRGVTNVETLDPLKTWFNRHRGKHRFVALLSPT